ncbi:MAG TPA: HD domain-containing phosphohydrolase [Vicinamibacterales bacterium]|nr:HD domain-containing phosphohydrolase [Vicinamibacterales bacterium]
MSRTAGRVLIVDDTAADALLLERLLIPEGYAIERALDGQDALEAVEREAPDLILTDVRMPRRNGFDLCRALKFNPETRLIPVVLLTGATEGDDRLRAIEAGADDFLSKPVDRAEVRARVRSLVRLKRFTDDLDSAEVVLRSLALMIEARDPYTRGHCQRLAAYGVMVGQRLGLVEDDLSALKQGGYFHDLGKIAIPDAILLKPGPLTPDEYEQMKEHSAIGDRLCGDLRVLHKVRPIVRHHHERLDGTGYPDGLRGDAIPLLAQIIGIVDVYDALTTDRPYRAALPAEQGFDELRKEVERGWRRSDLVEEFIAAEIDRRAVSGGRPIDDELV